MSTEAGYIKVDLPRWSNHLTIYVGNEPEQADGKPHPCGIVPKNAEQRKGKEYLATVNLSRLGYNVKWQRLRGNIRAMYVLGEIPEWKNGVQNAQVKAH
jgi:hypothetical protein